MCDRDIVDCLLEKEERYCEREREKMSAVDEV